MSQNASNVQIAMKRAVGEAAASLVQPGMKVGLGTGSTTAYFIQRLIERVHMGLVCAVLPSSLATERAAAAGGLPLLDPEHTDTLDLYVDGADQVDARWQLIKGGGGALMREKITAAMSTRFVVIVDASKVVQNLYGFKLPVEILPYGAGATLKQLKELGAAPQLRVGSQGGALRTDNDHWIADCILPHDIEPLAFAHRIEQLPGVLSHGLFVGLASEVWVGELDGSVRCLTTPSKHAADNRLPHA